MNDLDTRVREAFDPGPVGFDARQVTGRSQRRLRHRRLLTGMAAVSVMALFTGAAVYLAGSDTSQQEQTADPVRMAPLASGAARELAVSPDGTSVFVAVSQGNPDRPGGGINRIDTRTGEAAGLVERSGITEIAADNRSVYATGPELDRVYRFDSSSGEELGSLDARGPGPNGQPGLIPHDLAVAGDWLWLSHSSGDVFQIDTDGMRLHAVWGSVSSEPGEMIGDNEGVWLANRRAGVARLDAEGAACEQPIPPICVPTQRLELRDVNEADDVGDVYELAAAPSGVYALATTAQPNLESGTFWGANGTGAVTAFYRVGEGRPSRFGSASAFESAYITATDSRVVVIGPAFELTWVDAEALPPDGPFFGDDLDDSLRGDYPIAVDSVAEDVWILLKSGRIGVLGFTESEPGQAASPEVTIIDPRRP